LEIKVKINPKVKWDRVIKTPENRMMILTILKNLMEMGEEVETIQILTLIQILLLVAVEGETLVLIKKNLLRRKRMKKRNVKFNKLNQPDLNKANLK
jgi:hypothetical protein